MNKSYKDHILIFTDGSKSISSPSVGAACVIPQLNLTLTSSLINLASVYTAECLAVEMAVDYANTEPTKSYLICTDSLSLVHSLKAAPHLSSSNRHVANIKKGLQQFKNSSSENITLMWVPAHVGITGNELADREAKKASAQPTPQYHQVPHTDCTLAIKHKIQSITEEKWITQPNSGSHYFQRYFKRASTPWFHNHKISRHMIVWINRARAGHYSLASSLTKIGLAQDASCNCGHTTQDLDHIVWACPNLTKNREKMITLLKKQNIKPPIAIEILLGQPTNKLLQIIDGFIKSSNIKI